MSITLFKSVHDIVDVILRTGHLDNRIFNQSTMQEGTRLHSLYQHEQGSNYIAEYPVSKLFITKDYNINVTGKADGVIIESDELLVEEIKTTVADLNEFFNDHQNWHLAQALFYAYIIANENSIDKITIRLTYLKQQNYHMRKSVEYHFTFSEVKSQIDDILLHYTHYLDKVYHLIQNRDESLKNIAFPFKNYRSGQKEIVEYVLEAMNENQNKYIEAPTGIGKTLSVIYPLISNFTTKKVDKVVYLTSKNSIKKVAVSALKLFELQGSKLKTIEFTSKENICFNDKKGHCNPDECPYAKYYYDKILECIFDSLEYYDTFSRKDIENIAYENKLCPFQLQLDISNYCDFLICDYNYVFDYHDLLCLREGSYSKINAHLLIDECHNLPSRVRDSYSVELPYEILIKAKDFCVGRVFNHLKEDIDDILTYFTSLAYEKSSFKDIIIFKALSEELILSINQAISSMKSIIKDHTLDVNDDLLSFYYLLNNFIYLFDLSKSDLYENAFIYYGYLFNDQITSIKIYNLDSREIIKEGTSFFKSAVFFSATLSPKDYYIDLLGGNIEDKFSHLFLPSPFDNDKRRVLINDNISLKYKDRDATLFDVYDTVLSVVKAKRGNYFVFCPSFEYLDRLYSFFIQDKDESLDVLPQGRFMKEKDRDIFLDKFNYENEKTTIGLLVIGGIFSEGIDLVGDRLIGAIMISVGLPQISFERDKIKEYFSTSEDKMKGFKYAYTYPGINRILQSGGRVIRSEDDKGVLIYIDSRLKDHTYKRIFEEIYPDAIKCNNNKMLSKILKEFWEEEK